MLLPNLRFPSLAFSAIPQPPSLFARLLVGDSGLRRYLRTAAVEARAKVWQTRSRLLHATWKRSLIKCQVRVRHLKQAPKDT